MAWRSLDAESIAVLYGIWIVLLFINKAKNGWEGCILSYLITRIRSIQWSQDSKGRHSSDRNTSILADAGGRPPLSDTSPARDPSRRRIPPMLSCILPAGCEHPGGIRRVLQTSERTNECAFRPGTRLTRRNKEGVTGEMRHPGSTRERHADGMQPGGEPLVILLHPTAQEHMDGGRNAVHLPDDRPYALCSTFFWHREKSEVLYISNSIDSVRIAGTTALHPVCSACIDRGPLHRMGRCKELMNCRTARPDGRPHRT